jgi:hypothetical protein
MEQISAAVNARCKTAMQLAGYEKPSCSSLNTEGPKRPECITNINSYAATQAGGWVIRTMDVLILFFPENKDAPYAEIKKMSDCLTRAFLNPITVDGYQKLPNNGITTETDVEHDILDVTFSYEFEIAEEEIALDCVEEEEMEHLQESYEEG